MATLTSKIQSLLTYANGITEKNDTTLGDAVHSLADGYGQGGGDDVSKQIIERNVTSIIIPDGTTKIGAYCFYYWTTIQSITIPNSVTKLCNGCFYSCKALQNINIPNSVTTIESNVFTSCISIQSITIPSSVTSMNSYVFNSCTGLVNADLKCTLSSLPAAIFQNCTSLKNVILRSTILMKFTGDCFYKCNALEHIYVPTELVDSYKSASGYSAYADKISEIPEDLL